MNNTITGNATDIPVHVLYKSQVTTWLIILLGLDFFGAITNLCTLTASYLSNAIRQSSSWSLIAQSLFFDTLLCCIIYPIILIQNYFGPLVFPPGLALCRPLMASVFGVNTAFHWTMASIAINRFVAVILPHRYKPFSNTKVLALMLAIPWMIGITVWILVFHGIGFGHGVSLPWGGCASKIEMAYGVIPTFLPLTFVGLCYFFVLVKAELEAKKRTTRIRIECRNTARMLFASYCIYCFAIFPAYIIARVPVLLGYYFKYPMLQLAIKGLTYCSTSMNGLIFILLNKTYRKGVVYVVTCAGWFVRRSGLKKRSPVVAILMTVPLTPHSVVQHANPRRNSWCADKLRNNSKLPVLTAENLGEMQKRAVAGELEIIRRSDVAVGIRRQLDLVDLFDLFKEIVREAYKAIVPEAEHYLIDQLCETF